MTPLHLTELHESVEWACGLGGRSQWGRTAAAHAEMFTLLADVVDDDPLLTCAPTTAMPRAGDGKHLRGPVHMWPLALATSQADARKAMT